eukprot:gene528-6335_t
MDLFEANTGAQQYTTHACVDACGSYTANVSQCKGVQGTPSSVCDQSGCGLNPFRYGPGTTYDAEFNNDKWYGKGAGFALDSSSPFTVVTQFHTAAGALTNITRFYMQKGKRVDLPTLYPALTKDYCTDIYDRWDQGGEPLAQMGSNMGNGMVLAMSAWYAQETYVNGKPQGTQTGMSWLDGVNNWGKYIKAGPCDATTTDAGGPYHATFSSIRIGDIGTTLPSSPPAPGPAPPTPPTPPTPAPAPPAPPTPPSPSQCPGGSLTACMHLCPSSPAPAYKAC